MDGGSWQAKVHGITKELDMTESLGRGGVKTGLNLGEKMDECGKGISIH